MDWGGHASGVNASRTAVEGSPSAPAAALEDVTVDFPGTRALDGVSLDFAPGEVHAVVGENGAGKSTLMRTLAGLQRPTGGNVLIGGEAVALRSAAAAARLGVAMIHQELNLVDELSVAENLHLGREPTRRGLLRRRDMIDESRRLLASVGSDADPRARLGRLSVAQQQLVEIAKALGQDARVVIMDEPTAVLGERESAALFALVRRLRGEGRTVIYVSHRLAEVLDLSDRISVLRDGRLVATLAGEDMASATPERLASLMVGRPMGDHFPPRPSVGEAVAFEVENVSVPGVVHDVSFAVRAGEVFGLAGLIGAGRTETAEAVVGLRRRSSGAIRVGGEVVRVNDVADALRAGVAYLSEDRKAAGLLLEMGIAANTTMATLPRYCNARPLDLIDRKAESSVALAHAENLRTRFGRLGDPVSSLSGGNQQKVALAKWLDARPRVLILDEPTRGVDVGAKEEIYRVIAGLAAGGLACVVISSEMNELLGLCHRIGVMRGGRLVGTLDGTLDGTPDGTPDAEGAGEAAIMRLAAGVGE